MNMKKIRLIVIVVALLLITIPAMAVKPSGNLASASKIPWHLSGAVMPVAPNGEYGTIDIPGSDIVSKLIVSQPNGNTEVTITGVMNGLNPSTTYTVDLSNGYTPYTPISVLGTWKWVAMGIYTHDLIIDKQNPDGSFSGYGGLWAGEIPYYASHIINGEIVGNQVTLRFTVTCGDYVYLETLHGTINPDGSMSGNSPWSWQSYEGGAIPASGSTTWPGLFTSTVPEFTFITDASGSGSWHINLRDSDFSGTGTFPLSIWINGDDKTLLISDNFYVVRS
jgi:hypothetical protein